MSLIPGPTCTQLRRGVPADTMVEVILKLPKLIPALEDLHLLLPLPGPFFPDPCSADNFFPFR